MSAADRRCLAAFTARTPTYPQYVSINQHGDGTVDIHIRSMPVAHESKKFQVPGPEAMVSLTSEAFQALLLEAARNFRS